MDRDLIGDAIAAVALCAFLYIFAVVVLAVT